MRAQPACRWRRARVAPLLLIAVPVLLTALLAAESNRPSIDYIGAGARLAASGPAAHARRARRVRRLRPHGGLLGPAELRLAGHGPLHRPEHGPALHRRHPAAADRCWPALRGQLWAREIRFFTVAAGVALLYALGWYTPVFRLFYELLPGVSLYRRPADATFLIGALAAILAGYGTHRLFSEPHAELTAPAGR